MTTRVPKFWGLHAEPSLRLNWFLAALPFMLLIGSYLAVAHYRVSQNPAEKITPTISKMVHSIYSLAFTKDVRSGDYLLIRDTLSSLRRISLGIAFSTVLGLIFGLNTGLFPGMRALLLSFVTFFAYIPCLALLPILFIIFGIEETAKIVLIFIGTCPMIIRDLCLTSQKTTKEQITKALTLGATQFSLVYRVVLPQVMPRLIDAVRLSLGSAWLFLIAAEYIASTDGLGYRIGLMRRYSAMDVIIPYVLWITFLSFTMDWLLRFIMNWRYPWYTTKN